MSRPADYSLIITLKRLKTHLKKTIVIDGIHIIYENL